VSRHERALICTLVAAICVVGHAQAPRAPARPSPSGLDATRLALIEPLVTEAIARRELPGAVVLAGRGNQVLYKRAFGDRAVAPSVEPMTVDTIFDLASLTKVVATTTAVMLLVEDGRLRLSDRVSDHVPGFERYGKDRITIRQLLTHTSGLRPDLDLEEPFDGSAEAVRRAIEEVPVAPSNERVIYSDINFFLLGHIVERTTHEALPTFLEARVYGPLGMRDTKFLPAPSLRNRIAPTQSCEPLAWPCETSAATMLRGVVHDPTARRMGGYAGHAGLFGTADDLAIFARMLLNGGRWSGAPPLTRLSQRGALAGTSIRRSLGIAAICFPSARSATPASPGRRCGSIPPPRPS
jgi:CubicO group peptidase (beta-lactamase class C family)